MGGLPTHPVCDTEQETIEYIADNLPDRDTEYGGFIFKTEDGRFSYTLEEIGEGGGPLGNEPDGAVAGWHSHPDTGRDSDEFFSWPRNIPSRYPNKSRLYKTDDGDIAWVNYNKKPLYLITPKGKIKKASPDEIKLVYDPVEWALKRQDNWAFYYSGEQ